MRDEAKYWACMAGAIASAILGVWGVFMVMLLGAMYYSMGGSDGRAA